ncbi:conserved hypothetical protein [Luteimonas sp. 9C]|uniref:hypothetical protein n=1 Tax=Luteimonas sp. 9C TaxID=2653148 RepID=UPI0012F45B36|nr:hypothetical protein [Luteimonas sp. 9C]VXC02679.1 conserved hypothetical protein [Luteimonas sp. 9C]
MTINDATKAALHDLDVSLCNYGDSEGDRLKKIAALANMAVRLRESAPADERDWINQALHALAAKHHVPDECVLPQTG